MAIMNVPGATVRIPVTLTAASLSGAISIGSKTLVGIQFDADWDTAAVVSFQASAGSNGTYADVYDSTGTEVTPYAEASAYVALDPALTAGLTNFKVRAGATGGAVEQASTTLWLVCKEV